MTRYVLSIVLLSSLLCACGSGNVAVTDKSGSEGLNNPNTTSTGNTTNDGSGNTQQPGGNTDATNQGSLPLNVPTNCEAEITGAPGDEAKDFFRALGLCGAPLVDARFVRGKPEARAIRASLGKNFTAREGTKMVHLSTGHAEDRNSSEDFSPEGGTSLNDTATHPLWAPSLCGDSGRVSRVHDLTELEATIRVPAGANSFRFELNYFSAEYPEYVCTEYNDRFIAILESDSLDGSKLPGGAEKNCIPNASRPTCNISFDAKGQHVTVNSGFFSICESDPDLPACTQPVTVLEGTGYELPTGEPDEPFVGGATGWLSTETSVKEGETIKLRFIVLDEGDGVLDSAVLLDNFKWAGNVVAAPSTKPVLQ